MPDKRPTPDSSHKCYILHAINSQKLTMNGVQNITRGSLGKAETRFLAKIAGRATFTIEAARECLGIRASGLGPKILGKASREGVD